MAKKKTVAESYMGRGGYREGAGRPKGKFETESVRLLIQTRLLEQLEDYAAKYFVEKVRANLSHAINAILGAYFEPTNGAIKQEAEVEKLKARNTELESLVADFTIHASEGKAIMGEGVLIVDEQNRKIKRLEETVEKYRKVVEKQHVKNAELSEKIDDLENQLACAESEVFEASTENPLDQLAARLGVDMSHLEFTAQRDGKPRLVITCFSAEELAKMPDEKAYPIDLAQNRLLVAAACISALKKGSKT
jgi:uncharacterized coiled-coil DUF342 family protein